MQAIHKSAKKNSAVNRMEKCRSTQYIKIVVGKKEFGNSSVVLTF